VHHGSRETCSLDWSKSRLRRCKLFSASSRNVFYKRQWTVLNKTAPF
jgi:hypothetical protein